MLERHQIEAIIPHRKPMLLIDRILKVSAGEYAIGEMTVIGNEFFFGGHFPDNPVMPGVIIIEAMAQTGAVSILMLDEFKGKTGYFAGIDNARFKAKVLPGDKLTLEVRITKRKGPIGVGEGVAYVDGKKVAYATLTFAIG
ncbi:MAG: 3-hydroxyacyl-(acyl-carrier-protein) dehydratase FabZ [Firmicutes bacterium ADurb.Bin193]|nr:MAG: 3-hydroxyacyl-(acyl-carrier-protein) dehydratase FabZ [Firmicutes bacterium ADurb.Bin193]